METSYLELRCKEVVNIIDGKRLGHIVDVVFNIANGCVIGVVVPGDKSFWNVFKGDSELFIPLKQIIKIGQDTILVEVIGNTNPYLLKDAKKK